VITYGLPAPACLLLVQSEGSLWLISAGVILLGYTGGGALQLSTYLTTRYAGLHKFGTIYGIISTLMGLASGVGPLLAGAIFDMTGSYSVLLAIGILTGLVAGVAVFGRGRFPELAPREA
jgi:MFS family permease